MTSIDEITQIEQTPLSDVDVKYYLGDDARVLIYDELAKYNTLEELLPESKSFIVLLFPVKSETNGHYCALYRLNDNIYYCDSYGFKPDKPLSFSPKYKNTPKHLTMLFDNSTLPIYYNTIDFQNKKDLKMADCGRYSIFYILVMKEFNADLSFVISALQDLNHQKPNQSYDDIICGIINKH